MKNVVLSLLLLGTYITGYAQVAQSPYQTIVSADGSGNFRTIQAAINAVPDGRTEPWMILLKNGSYNEQVVIPESKPYIHLIGQDREKTIIHLNLNVGGKITGRESEGKSLLCIILHLLFINMKVLWYWWKETIFMLKTFHL